MLPKINKYAPSALIGLNMLCITDIEIAKMIGVTDRAVSHWRTGFRRCPKPRRVMLNFQLWRMLCRLRKNPDERYQKVADGVQALYEMQQKEITAIFKPDGRDLRKIASTLNKALPPDEQINLKQSPFHLIQQIIFPDTIGGEAKNGK